MKVIKGLILATLLALAGCNTQKNSTAAPLPEKNASSNTVAITAAEPSPHFVEVMKHLDVGAKSLQFEDYEGRREFWIGLFDLILSSIPKEALQVDIDAATLVDDSALAKAAASGRSWRKDGDTWLMRQYTSYPEGLPGMVNEMLGEKQPFKAATRLPAGTDLAIEGKIITGSLPRYLREIGKLAGKEQEIGAMLGQPLPIGMNLEELLSQLKLDVTAGIDIENTIIPSLPVMPRHFALEIKTDKKLIEQCIPLLSNALGEAKTLDAHQTWPLPLPPIPGLAKGTPHLIYDGDQTLTLASSLEYFAKMQDGNDKLAGNPQFIAATDHFDSSGHFLAYASPAVATAAYEWLKDKSAGEKDMDALVGKLGKMVPNKPWSICVACEANGINTIAESPFAIDSNAASTLTMLSATSTLFVGARAWKRGSDRAACILNIRNVQQAVRAHQGMNGMNLGDPIDWDYIFGPKGFLQQPVCPSGGTYTFSKTHPEIGTLACTCSHAQSENHEPDNHGDW